MVKFHVSANKFKQQRLPAWQPILTASSVLPTFFAIGVVFIPIGVGLLHLSQSVKNHSFSHSLITFTNGSNQRPQRSPLDPRKEESRFDLKESDVKLT